ncbi:MAG: flagellar basal-body MS-ring/collar protein FliF [Fimbriimonadaceae bacterium]
MASILLKVRTWWETADRTQKAVTLFGGGFLLLLLVGTFYFASRPKMEMAFGGLAAAEQGSVVAEIQKLGIPVEFDVNGNVLVPSAKVSEVKMRLATAGKLPSASHWGYSDLDKLSSFSTPRVEKERLKSVMEGELAKTIESFDSVDSARVHITLGEEAVFANERTQTTASVTIGEASGGTLSGEEAKAIASLVANSVPGLTTKNLTIMDTNLKPIWLGDSETGVNGLANERIAAEISEAKRRERELQQKLDYFFGAGAAAVTVDLKLDFDTATEKKTEPIVGDPISVESMRETMSGGSGSAPIGGPAGVGSNAPGEAGGGTAAGGGQEGYLANRTNTVSASGSRETQTQKSPGEVKSMSIAVMVDKKKVKNTAEVQAFVDSYLGPKKGDPNFTALVTSVDRSTEADTAAKTAAAAASGRDRMQQIFSLLPIVALLAVAFVVVKSLAKAAKAQNVLVAALPGGRTMPMALTSGDTKREQTAPDVQMARALEARSEPLENIPARINKPLEQIKMMSADRPEVVAMLLKSWLLEDRK